MQVSRSLGRLEALWLRICYGQTIRIRGAWEPCWIQPTSWTYHDPLQGAEHYSSSSMVANNEIQNLSSQEASLTYIYPHLGPGLISINATRSLRLFTFDLFSIVPQHEKPNDSVQSPCLHLCGQNESATTSTPLPTAQTLHWCRCWDGPSLSRRAHKHSRCPSEPDWGQPAIERTGSSSQRILISTTLRHDYLCSADNLREICAHGTSAWRIAE